MEHALTKSMDIAANVPLVILEPNVKLVKCCNRTRLLLRVRNVLHPDVDECSTLPCMNHGTCIDQVNGYSCECNPGFTGPKCESGTVLFLQYHGYIKPSNLYFQDVDECSTFPCLNHGTCTDEVNGYSCKCPPGYVGIKCETGKTLQSHMLITK